MWQLIGVIAGGIVAVVVGNLIVEEVTGAPITEHAMKWWCSLREAIHAWQRTNPGRLARFIGRVVGALDAVAVDLKNTVDFYVLAVDSTGSDLMIDSRRVSLDELHRKFPTLKLQGEIDLTDQV